MASNQPDLNKQRRRLLKATAGAPVIFTLPVGKSAAAASIACDTKEDSLLIVNQDDFESEFGEVDDGDTVNVDGQDYVYDEPENRLVTASCWSSLMETASLDSTNKIV